MRILYAEDERSLSEAVVDILEYHNYVVDAVYDVMLMLFERQLMGMARYLDTVRVGFNRERRARHGVRMPDVVVMIHRMPVIAQRMRMALKSVIMRHAVSMPRNAVRMAAHGIRIRRRRTGRSRCTASRSTDADRFRRITMNASGSAIINVAARKVVIVPPRQLIAV